MSDLPTANAVILSFASQDAAATLKPPTTAAPVISDRTARIDEAVTAQRRVIESYSSVTRGQDRWGAEVAPAEPFAYAGRARECFVTLAPLLRVPSGLTVPMLRVDPTWDNVREDAGFKALLADPKNSAPL